MFTLITCILILLLITYGVFFLIFELIWLLFKNKRVFWPLILAGVATLLVALLTTWACYSTYTHYVKPFSPIMQAINQKTLVTGSRTYTDPQDGFTLTLQNGTTLSDWISSTALGNIRLLVGIDTNAFIQANKKNTDDLAVLLVIRQEKKYKENAITILEQFANQVKDNNSPSARIEITGQPQTRFLAENTDAAQLSGIIYSPNIPQGMPATLLLVSAQDITYFIVGFGNTTAQEMAASFRLH